nr:hypothetical protein [Bacilli bacterium]
MNVSDSYDYNELEFKRVNRIIIPDMNNKFINEEMLLSPLYKKIEIDKTIEPYEFFPMSDLKVECYCKECNRRRIYTFADSQIALNSAMRGMELANSISSSDISELQYELEKIDYFTFCAQADCGHNMIILFKVIDNENIMKVGQYPSIYDLNEKINNKEFIKTLGKEYADYYKKACALYNFDTYIGGLAYLRRIYEKLLLDTFNDNKNSFDITVDQFKKMRMDEKIPFLKKYLPNIMFAQGFNEIYTKISDGIHNLSEDECYKMFLTLKMGIEEILIEKMENVERNKRICDLSKELQKT